MKDIISELNNSKSKPSIQFEKINPDAFLPQRTKFSPSILILRAYEDYDFTVSEDVALKTGVRIKSANNVDISVFASYPATAANIPVSQGEIFINPERTDQLIFASMHLFATEYAKHSLSYRIVINRGDPLCYIKITPRSYIDIQGVE